MFCPITYEKVPDGSRYSPAGLRKFSSRLNELRDFPYTAEEQVREAAYRASRMSIQGVQPKLSAMLDVNERRFVVVDRGGLYILKPKNLQYPELPENEDLTMRLADIFGIEVPFHGLIYSKDGSLTYLIRRYDRPSSRKKLPVEDFAQLSGRTRDTKYDASMEQVAQIIEKYTSFPVVEKARLFTRILFAFVTGNEDMHLKNWSIIRRGGKVELTPAYDLLNTSIVLGDPEETALPINGKKRKLHRNDIVDYFGRGRLGISDKVIKQILERLEAVQVQWQPVIERSFLSDEMKLRYRNVIRERMGRIFGV